MDSPLRDTEAAAEAVAGRAVAGVGVGFAVGAGAAGAAAGATGSPSKAAISESLSAGSPFRPRRACSAAMVDLLHFRPSATHLATSALIGPADESRGSCCRRSCSHGRCRSRCLGHWLAEQGGNFDVVESW